MSRFLATRDGALGTLLVSGALGFWLGIAAFPQWQVAVETAQVIARLVTYPPDNPFHVYHARLWTVLHEIAAALLRMGVSELTASTALSGLLGMVSLQALAMIVYAFSRDAVFSIGASFAIFLSRSAEFGGRYPISLMGTQHTYGAFGLSGTVLAAALLGSGRHRLGGLLLGAMPAIHPAMGIWGLAIVAACLAIDFARRRSLLRPALPWFIGGCALSAVSLIVHLALAPAVATGDTASAQGLLPTLVKNWDGHRQPAYLDNPAVYLNFAAVPFVLTWLLFLRDKLPPASTFLLRFAAVSSLLAIVFVFVSWVPERIPDFIQILMPLRLLNVVSMMFAAILLGLAATYRRTTAGQIAMALLLGALLLGDRSHFWRTMPDVVRGLLDGLSMNTLTVMVAGAAAVTMFAAIERRIASRSRPDAGVSPRAVTSISLARTALLLIVAGFALSSLRETMPRALKFRDRTHDPVFSAAAAGDGLLLTGQGLRLIQLRTRRPVLLDTSGFDGVVYSLDALPRMLHILRDVYDIDLLNPTPDGPGVDNLRAWQRYSLDRWQEIRRTYNVTQVLTERHWHLDLPVVAETMEMRLYEIPLQR